MSSTGDGCPAECQCTVHWGAFPWVEGGSRTVREKHKTSDDVCQARQGGGVFPACLAARSISVARRSYLSAGLYLLVRVSIPGPVRGRGGWGRPSRAWLFPRAVADHSRSFLWYTRLRLTWCLNLVCWLPVYLSVGKRLRFQESGLAYSLVTAPIP